MKNLTKKFVAPLPRWSQALGDVTRIHPQTPAAALAARVVLIVGEALAFAVAFGPLIYWLVRR